jgi:ribosomal protein S13
MARIAGVDLPPNKRIEIALTYIFGIGRTQSNKILKGAGVNLDTKVRDLNDDETNKIRKIIEEQHRVFQYQEIDGSRVVSWPAPSSRTSDSRSTNAYQREDP